MQLVRLAHAVVGVALGACVIAGCGGSSAPYTSFTHKDQVFQCEYPTGWHSAYGADVFGDETKANFLKKEPGFAKVQIVTQARSNWKPESTCEDVHKESTKQYTSHYKKYEESAPSELKSGFGSGVTSTFQAEVYDRSDRGIRATLLNDKWKITVVCVCEASLWDQSRGQFEHVLQSIKATK